VFLVSVILLLESVLFLDLGVLLVELQSFIIIFCFFIMTLLKDGPSMLSIDAKPYAFSFPLTHTALLVIDMQRDFLLSKGFGEIQGGNLKDVQASIAPTKKLLEACRNAGMTVFHTREGHVPDLSDCPSSKLVRQAAAPNNTQHKLTIGERGELGRLLVRGEFGHDIINELKPLPGEVVIDKPGKGSFWNTTILHKLKARAITHLIVSGVTTECCFATSIREANDRGFECCMSFTHTPSNPALTYLQVELRKQRVDTTTPISSVPLLT
jgi:nicotinamidase-related amidase